MQRFDYMGQKQAAKNNTQYTQVMKEPNIISQQQKTQEQVARDKLNEQKKVAQDEVDSVLYQDAREARKSVPTVTSGNNVTNNSSSSDTVPVTPVVKKHVVTSDVSEKKPVVHNTTVVPPKKTRYDDAIIDEFKENFDKTDTSDAVHVSPNDVHVTNPVEPVASREVIPTVSVAQSVNEESYESYSNSSGSKSDIDKKKEAVTSAAALSKDAIKNNTANGKKIPMANLKKVPSYLVQPIQKLFGASNQSDAIAALCYYFLGKSPDIKVDDKIKELADSFNDNDISIEEIKEDLHKDLSDIKASNRALMSKLITIELGVAYGLFDDMGFRKLVQESPGNVELMEHGMSALIANMEKTSSLYQNRQAKAGKL